MLYNHAYNFFEDNKNKFFPKEEDINPNKKFIDNLFFRFFLSDKKMIKELESKDIQEFINQNPKSVDFNEIKSEIKSFITINIFSLLCKL